MNEKAHFRYSFERELEQSLVDGKIRTYSAPGDQRRQVKINSRNEQTGKVIIEPVLGGDLFEVDETELVDNGCFGKYDAHECDKTLCKGLATCRKITSEQKERCAELREIAERLPAGEQFALGFLSQPWEVWTSAQVAFMNRRWHELRGVTAPSRREEPVEEIKLEHLANMTDQLPSLVADEEIPEKSKIVVIPALQTLPPIVAKTEVYLDTSNPGFTTIGPELLRAARRVSDTPEVDSRTFQIAGKELRMSKCQDGSFKTLYDRQYISCYHIFAKICDHYGLMYRPSHESRDLGEIIFKHI